MEINLSENLRKIILSFFLVILPVLILLSGVVLYLLNALFYILTISWFGTGLIFYTQIKE